MANELKAYYRFESGALTTDSSAQGHTLTAISDPAEDASGKFGGAVALDGNDAYSATDHADFKPTGNFTIGAWVKGAHTGATQFVFESYSKNTKVAGIRLTVASTDVASLMSGNNSGATSHTNYEYATGTVNVLDGNWHFVVGTWDGSYIKVYTDGGDMVQTAWANAPAYASKNYVRIGCNNESGTNVSFLTGSLDDVFLLNGTALSAEEIKGIYSGMINSFNGI